MKKYLALILAAAMLAACSGCTANTPAEENVSVSDTESTPAAEESTPVEESTPAEDVPPAEDAPPAEEEIDYASLTDEEIYELMVKRSLMSTGDMTRMANVLNKAANGEEITAAYIGGSITEGYHDGLTLTTDQKWAKMATDYLSEQYPSATVNYVNAGLSGTPSVLGNVRLERDVLASDPDIVFVEFAVNDGTETIYKNAYESLVRTLLTQEKDIAVVLLFTFIESGHTCQPHMAQIGEHYDLPMISLPDSIKVEMDEGRMTWDDYSGDASHPHVEGSKMIRDLIINYYENVIPAVSENVGEVSKELPEPIFSGDYAGMTFLDSTNMTDVELNGFAESDTHAWFNDGWKYKGKDGASMKFTVSCKKLGLVFKANNSAMYGTAEIIVDGESAGVVASNMADGWNQPVTQYIIDGETAAEHTVELKIAGGENSCFFVLGFGACE